MRGVVLQTYGAGNVPAEQPVLLALKEACDRGVVVVNCTQCMQGNVTTNYPAARVSTYIPTYVLECDWASMCNGSKNVD